MIDKISASNKYILFHKYDLTLYSNNSQCNTFSEEISEALEKLLQQDLETDEDVEESLFNQTITTEVGKEIARRIRKRSIVRTMSSGSDSPPYDTDDKAGDQTDDGKVIDPQVYTHVGPRTSQVVLPRVLQEYPDMGQEEYVVLFRYNKVIHHVIT